MHQMTKLTFEFYPSGTPTVQDQKGDHAYVTWSAMIAGKLYGGVVQLGKVNDLTTADWQQHIANALIETAAIRKRTPEEREQDQKLAHTQGAIISRG